MNANAKQAYLLIAFILLPLTAFTQDSLRLVPVKAWQLSRLIDETKAGRVCDATLTKYINLVGIYEESQKTKDSLIYELNLSRNTWKYTSEQKDSIITNRDLINKAETKQLRKQKFKLTLLAIGEGVVIVLLIL